MVKITASKSAAVKKVKAATKSSTSLKRESSAKGGGAVKKVAKLTKTVAMPSAWDYLSVCGKRYAIACADPFDPEARGACVPAFPLRDSEKFHSFQRGVLTLSSANGFGFVMASPTLASDGTAIYHSLGSYASANTINADVVKRSALEASAQTLGSGYTEAQLKSGNLISANAVSGRIVSAGLRVRYIGKNDDMAGRMIGFVNRDHGNINNTLASDIMKRDDIINVPVTREWATITIAAQHRSELEYPDAYHVDGDAQDAILKVYPFSARSAFGTSAPDNENGGAPMVWIMIGTASTQYEYEYVQHSEYVGELTQNQRTQDHSLPGDLNIVQQIWSTAQGQGGDKVGQVKNRIVRELKRKGGAFVGGAGGLAATLGTAFLGAQRAAEAMSQL